MKIVKVIVLIFFFELVFSLSKVCKVIDGDTFNLCNRKKIRIWGIDAPEYKQKYGKESKMMLKSLIMNKEVDLKCYDKSYDREVCKVFVDRKDIGSKMVEAGLAFDYRYHSKDFYQKEEEAAKKRRVGIWENGVDNVESPYEFRKKKRRKSWF